MSTGPTPENRARLMLALIAWGKLMDQKPSVLLMREHENLMHVIDDIFAPTHPPNSCTSPSAAPAS